MTKIIDYALIISLLTLIVSYWQRNHWSEDLKPLPQLQSDPLQYAINKKSFGVSYNDEQFQINPRFDYVLYGLVVSYRVHQPEHQGMLHALNKDYLNVSDLCVVWGESADPQVLSHFKFANGQFSCQYQTGDNLAWQAFNPNKLSNNHLLSVDDSVRATIEKIKIGDQIRISGWLSHYINPQGFERGTSIVRTDTGEGACETIFVNEIEILTSMTGPWRRLMWISLFCFVFFLGLYIRRPLQARN